MTTALLPEERASLPCRDCGGREVAVLIASPAQCREVREILRGLEHIGLASCRGRMVAAGLAVAAFERGDAPFQRGELAAQLGI